LRLINTKEERKGVRKAPKGATFFEMKRWRIDVQENATTKGDQRGTFEMNGSESRGKEDDAIEHRAHFKGPDAGAQRGEGIKCTRGHMI
jgi:hypothetical protein